MFNEDYEKRIQERYPTIHLRWNGQKHTVEVWEKHGDMRIGKGWRHLWTYRNDDGTTHPIIYDTLLNWLLKADTRHWPDRFNLFEEVVRQREKGEADAHRALENEVHARVVDDYTRIAGIKTFFMDPSSCPQRVTTMTPSAKAIMRRMGHTEEVPL